MLLPPANEVWGKVIFSVACVNNSVQRGGGGIPACLAGGIPACLAGLKEGGSPGPNPGVLQAHTWRGVGVSQHALRQTPVQLTATAARGTHPTGMHSCYDMQQNLCTVSEVKERWSSKKMVHMYNGH